VKAGFAQIVDIADISGDIKRNAASTVGYETVLINDGNLGVGLQSFEPAGRFGSEGDTADCGLTCKIFARLDLNQN
jgi:hypothetical protein